MRRGICPKCKRDCVLTNHHIYPVRFFGHRNKTICLCRKCHNEIESKIPAKERQPKVFYQQVVRQFIT